VKSHSFSSMYRQDSPIASPVTVLPQPIVILGMENVSVLPK